MKPTAIDLFCCGGGASEGLRRAGFNVIGVDIEPQPHYPFPFLQADVMQLDPEWIASFAVAWAFPPCQRYTRGAAQHGSRDQHPDLVGPVRDMLAPLGIPFVIENVPEAPLRRDLLLCGSMFDLRLIRHRVFECHGFTVVQPEHGEHHPEFVTVAGGGGRITAPRKDGRPRSGGGTTDEWREALGIDWLPRSRMREAIPPAYSQLIGEAMLAEVWQVAA